MHPHISQWSAACSAAPLCSAAPAAGPFDPDRAPVAMEPAARGVQVPTATAGAVGQDVVEAIAGLHIAPEATGGGGSCRPRRVVWRAQNDVVEIPEKDDSGSADETAAGVRDAEDATAGAVVEGPAETGSLPASSSDRGPPPGGVAQGRWKGWYDPKRWHMVGGREMYRAYGEGPETGGHDCPQSADPRRTERNKRKKEKKERIRREREADQTKAETEAWRRSYERQVSAPSRWDEPDDGTDTSEGPPAP